MLREKSRCEMLRVLKVLEKRLWTVCRPCMVEVFEVNMLSCVGLFDGVIITLGAKSFHFNPFALFVGLILIIFDFFYPFVVVMRW